MSRRDEFKQLINPATKFIDWSSENKCFKYYQKSKIKDQKGEIKLEPLPFGFLVLKECYTIKGFHKTAEAGIWSNEVENIDDILHVKYGNKLNLVSGKYKDIRDAVTSVGGKFCISVYAMLKDGSLVNLQMYGAALGAWIEFTQKTKSRLPDEWVMISDSKEEKTGGLKYHVPVFKFAGSIEAGGKFDQMAEYAYNTLKEYLTEYFKKPSNDIDAVAVPEADIDEDIERRAAEYYNQQDQPMTTEDKTKLIYGNPKRQPGQALHDDDSIDAGDDDLPF